MKIESQFLNRAYFGLFMIWMFFKICRRKISKDLQKCNKQIKKWPVIKITGLAYL
jgi:hypothetical protein